MEVIKNIHDRLYTNELKQFDVDCDYIPHMTVGKVSSMELLDEAFDDVSKCNDKFSTVVKKISVEMIGAHEESIIIIEHELNWQIPICQAVWLPIMFNSSDYPSFALCLSRGSSTSRNSAGSFELRLFILGTKGDTAWK